MFYLKPGWKDHKPGDPMPVHGDTWVNFRTAECSPTHCPIQAKHVNWEGHEHEIQRAYEACIAYRVEKEPHWVGTRARELSSMLENRCLLEGREQTIEIVEPVARAIQEMISDRWPELTRKREPMTDGDGHVIEVTGPDGLVEEPAPFRHRLTLLEKVHSLASELCDAVDCEAEDVGGQRPSGEILRELGPACQAVTYYDKTQPIET